MRGTDFKTEQMFQQMDKALLTILVTNNELKSHIESMAIDAGVPLSYIALCSLVFAMKKVKKFKKYEYERCCTKLRTDYINYFMDCAELKSKNK